MWPNRTLCECLEEMRKAYKTRNFSYLPGLIEEAQSMGNRMESALADKRTIKEFHEEKKKLKKDLGDLRAYAEWKREREEERKAEVSSGHDDPSRCTLNEQTVPRSEVPDINL